ncbi:hypothetical protein OJAV_G00115040 [Oryzias javanicus]|uniref:Tudor domain-containing protein n=1 Tax=Oryzias javanicus TaxID=123683 RepID=A0A437CX80_ORYJA|nr:hypothetical protein OJAV_G00115040 [Oryzias javanicus]
MEKIVAIITKADGRLKYRVSFEERGKCVLSGHHIAFDSRPKVEQLCVGARVGRAVKTTSSVEDVLDDVPDGAHKCFMKQYLRDWPYPRTFKYALGQHFTVELDGVMRRCEVAAVDCSLVQVVFEESQRREWIYRGSMRLQHFALLEPRWKEDDNNSSDSD